jgi:hypothetical protein
MTQNFELGGATGSGLSSVINRSQQYVFFVDKNEDVKELYFNGTSWSAFDFTAQTNGAANALAGSGLSASFNENGDPTTVYVGSDSNVHRASGTSSHWYTDQRTTSGTVSNGSGLTALFSGYQDIYYLSTN